MTETFHSIITTRRVVRNLFPIDEPGESRIALIGEAPGEDEEAYGVPFIGKSGDFLKGILRSVGIDSNKCFFGNVCQVRPPANRIEAFDFDGPQIQDGIKQLHEDLATFNPTICVLLGNTPLRVAKGTGIKITGWRGSLFRSTILNSPFYNRKCIASLHPAFVLREFSGFPLLKFDLNRAKQESATSDLYLPSRELLIPDAATLVYLMDSWPAGQRCSLDIEGGLPLWQVNEKAKKKKQDGQTRYGWPCVSICARPTKSYTIAWGRFNVDEHVRVLRSFARLMFRRDVPKVLQNQLYDNFCLSFGYGIPIRNVTEDVMIKGWEVYAELPRSLSTQASIWTRQPHWKDDSMYESNGDGLFKGCAMDSAVTLEICNAQDTVLVNDPTYRTSMDHYRKMISMQNPFLYMELKGIKYDQENVTRMLQQTTTDLEPIAASLEDSAGCSLRGPKGSLVPQRLVKALYVDKSYPPQYAKGEHGKRTDKLTTDIEAILNLKKHFPEDEFLSNILRHRHLEGVRETLQITADVDGRVRCGYSIEAETGRVKCYTSPTGSGANLTTIQKVLRSNYIADTGCDFFNVDLEGADGWTVAAHCKRLGDPNMFNDYLAGMKPAKIIALMYYFGPVINQLSRSDVKWLHDNVLPHVLSDIGKWLYLGCKRVQHGSSYLMGIPTMLLNILKDSFKESGTPIYMAHKDGNTLQQLLFLRYPGLQRWHQWAESHLVAHGTLTAASGHTRVFFGRRFGKGIKDTVKEFLAHEPQNNTTWATNLAMLNLWNDPDNRVGAYSGNGSSDYLRRLFSTGGQCAVEYVLSRRDYGSLIIEPNHQVHDALNGQWPKPVRPWAIAKIKTYFNNELEIAGTRLVIPFDGGFGESWGSCDTKI